MLVFVAGSQGLAASQQSTQQSAPTATPSPAPAPTPPPANVPPQPSPVPEQAQPVVQPTPTPQPPPAPESVPQQPEEIVFVAVGDVMLGTTFPDESGGDLPPKDGAEILQEVTPILKLGDVTFGNLEGPLVDGGVSAKCRGKRAGTCYAFRVPTRYGKYLKEAGFTVMGLANNHAMDFGQEGRTSSRQTLDALGIAHSGEVGDIARLTVKGRKVTVIAFATYPNAHNLLDQDEALQTIRDARAEADIVIVSFHGGAEGATHQHVPAGDETFLGEDRGDLRKFAHAAVEAGAQVVVGSGPHVVRGMEIYQGKLIAYSLGNFATYGPFNLSGENGLTLILEAHLGPDGTFLGGHVHPVKQEKPGGPRLDSAQSILPILRDLSSIDFGANSVKVSDDGGLLPPAKDKTESSRESTKMNANEKGKD
ncbi:MAG TPA: CapA family protein [Candidatus Angelobacter sp.]|nr:CapA family protein [Candidatus Angelobacter sp.]